MYRLIASDMDETFLGKGHCLPAANVRALERLHELGVIFVPNSGRPYPSIKANFAGIDPRIMENTYVLSYNGGYINRFGDPTPLVSCTIDRPSLEWLYHEGVKRRQCLHLYTASGRVLTQFMTEAEFNRLAGGMVREDLPEDVDLIAYAGDDPLVKIILLECDPVAARQEADELMTQLDPAKIEVTFSSQRYIEFMPAGVNKGKGIARLAELLDIDLADTIALGDAENDIDALRTAGLGVGVANVTDAARPYCDLVLSATATDGALAELVERVIEPEHAR